MIQTKWYTHNPQSTQKATRFQIKAPRNQCSELFQFTLLPKETLLGNFQRCLHCKANVPHIGNLRKSDHVTHLQDKLGG